jgi:hypothetical protein
MTAESIEGLHIMSVDEMLAADDVEYKTIPTWMVKDKTGALVQGYVRIGSLSAEQVAEWRDTTDGPAKKTMGTRLFVDSLVDKDGKRIGNPTFYAAFRKKSNAVQERVLAAIVELNGLVVKKEDLDKAKNG